MAKLQLKQAVNYGLEKVRFIAPVRAGKRVRNHIKIVALEDKGSGRFLLTTENTFEIEGEEKPALVRTVAGHADELNDAKASITTREKAMSTTASAAPEQTPQRSRIGKLTPGARAAAKRSAKQPARVTVKQRAARTGQAAAQAVRATVATASQGAMQVTGELSELVTGPARTRWRPTR